MDAEWLTTFKPDHTLLVTFDDNHGGWTPPVSGTWRLDGADLKSKLSGGSKITKKTEHILKFEPNRLVLDGFDPYLRVK
jgi:hypothetical protein